METRDSRLLACLLAAALGGWACASVPAPAVDCAASAGPVTALLRDGEGRVLYVEAQAMASVGSDLWIAGAPTFVWRERRDSFLPDTSDKVLAALIRPGAPALAVHPPAGLPGVADPRLAALGGGMVGVVFADMSAPPRPGTEVPFRRFHYGELSPGEATLRTTPLPVGYGIPRTYRASRLTVAHGSVAFAVPARQGDRTDVDVFLRRPGGRWEVEHVTSRYAEYVSLIDGPAGRLVLLVVRPDTTAPEDANSLSVFERTGSGAWQDRGFLRRSGRRPAHFPEVIRTEAGAMVAWMEEDERGGVMSARFGALDLRAWRLRTLDAWIPGVESVTPIEGGAGPGEWLLEARPSNGRGRALQVVRQGDSTVSLLASVPNPFTGPVRAFHRGGNLVVIGPVIGEFPSAPLVASAFLPLMTGCVRRASTGLSASNKWRSTRDSR